MKVTAEVLSKRAASPRGAWAKRAAVTLTHRECRASPPEATCGVAAAAAAAAVIGDGGDTEVVLLMFVSILLIAFAFTCLLIYTHFCLVFSFTCLVVSHMYLLACF